MKWFMITRPGWHGLTLTRPWFTCRRASRRQSVNNIPRSPRFTGGRLKSVLTTLSCLIIRGQFLGVKGPRVKWLSTRRRSVILMSVRVILKECNVSGSRLTLGVLSVNTVCVKVSQTDEK